ncbi:hypothetical protein Mlg_2088 [Alkalilimnicola ehrlichii MLHE-1]|uniref:Thymidine phosphorylase n=1 Tax=Alkalilimnicola ehrlichii (strain ATCC BAA-1101 / DSM 17681 / MLHE-1) TaxID=187272 RepID=Q0A6V7_ALKEH|nr:hypothetical protein Mlg_2088 [Alkalilimnicola ehrlichii MLHE-1]
MGISIDTQRANCGGQVADRGGKVVYLRREASNVGQPMPERVADVSRLAEERLLTLIRRVFDEADDTLFDCARPVVAEGGRDHYLRAMRELRLRRHELEEVFRAGLEARFTALPSPMGPPVAGDSPSPDATDLDARELALAVDALAAKARRRFSPQLVAVTRLLGREYPGGEVREEDNPLDPGRVAQCFARAIDVLRVGLEPRLVLLKLFDRHLMRGLGAIYAEVETAMTGRAPVVPARGPSGLDHAGGGSDPADPGTQGAAGLSSGADRDAERAMRQQAEENRSQVEAARERVRREVGRCLEGRNPPRLVRELLEDTWSRVLFITCLKEGVDSETWVRQCALMERLLWSVEPHDDPVVQQQLVVEIPLLLHELAEGLSWVLYNPFEMHKLLRALEAEHLRCLQAADPALDESVWPAEAEAVGADPRDLEANRQRLRQVPVGTWFEFLRDHGRRLQGRLAERRDDGRAMVFANRAGFKVLETGVDDLAQGLADSSVLILDDNRLFNTALADVVRRLKERHAGQRD